MRRLLFIAFALSLTVIVNAQYFTVTNLSGTVLYGTTNVTVTSAGAVSAIPYCGVNPYWIGSGSGTVATPGGYTFTFSSPVSAVRVYVTAADHHLMGTLDSEKIYIDINGASYWLTPANFSVWGGTCSQPAATVLGGKMVAVIDFGAGAGGQLDVSAPLINSCRVHTNGVYNGSTFTFQFITGATNNGPVCSGDSLRLYWNGDSTGATYYWYGPGGFTSTLQNPVVPGATIADTGLYYVIKTVGAIVDTSVTRVAIKPLPIILATSNSPICQGAGNTLNLFANPDSIGQTYLWTGPGSFTSTLRTPTITGFTAADTGTYKVVATLHGCTDSATTYVILAPVPPPPVISGITSYCSGQPFVPFTVAGSGAILWYTAGTGGVGSSVAPVAPTAVAGTYTFWASQTILGCESMRDSIIVTVHPTPPPPAITGTSVYCQYFSYIPPVATGLDILWYTTATGGTGSVTTPTVNTNVAGIYTIYATQTSDTGCESPKASFAIIVNPKPIPPAITNNPGRYCPGQAFVPFTIVSGTGVLWYSASVGGVGSIFAPSVSTVIPGAYKVWASQTVLGCESDRDSITIYVYDSITSGFTYDLKYGCKADTLILTNTSTKASTFRWDFGDGFTSSIKDPVHIYLTQAIDTVRLLSSSATCSDSFKLGVHHLHPLKAQFTSDTNLICQGNTISFTDASVGTGLSHLWLFGDGSTSTTASPSHLYTRSGVYKVMEIAQDFIPCYDTATRTISVDTISPIGMVISDTVFCTGTHITFTGRYSSIGNTGVDWYMGNGDSIKDENPLKYGYGSIGKFTVTAKARYRVCPEPSVSRAITVLPPPQLYVGPDTTICKGGVAITLRDNLNAGDPEARWLWSTGQTTSGISVSEPGIYTATVTKNGCKAQDAVVISNDCYMNIPNVFTPNADGMNDYFFPRQLLTKGLASFRMSIYNRWGTLIFESTSLSGSGWDGKFNNADQPVGVYVYIIDGTFKDGQKEHHQGNVTLLR